MSYIVYIVGAMHLEPYLTDSVRSFQNVHFFVCNKPPDYTNPHASLDIVYRRRVVIK